MNIEQVIHIAVDKALRNGWSGGVLSRGSIDQYVQKHQAVILSPEFAKAFWGETHDPGIDGECMHCGQGLDLESFWTTLPCWHYALQQMALEKDPVKYLERFLSVANTAC